ncbi:MAG: hypothetical protein Q9222_000736 [Ikaeria aurantiellina]
MPSSDLHQAHIDWLDLALNDDQPENVNKFDQTSQRLMQKYLEETTCTVKSPMPLMSTMSGMTNEQRAMTSESTSQNLEIDLDAFFDGQGATDLDDEETMEVARDEEDKNDVGTDEEEMIEIATNEDIAIESAARGETIDTYKGEEKSLADAEALFRNRPRDASLAPFLQYDQRLQDQLRWVFDTKGLPYTGRGCIIAASDVAYTHFGYALQALRQEENASRPILSEMDRSQDWFFQQSDKVGNLPYDPRQTHVDTLPDAESKCQEPDEPVDHRYEHYNFFGERVFLRSETPAAVSLYVQLAASRKRMRDIVSREGVVLSQANKFIDPVYYDGPAELLQLEGSSFQDQTTGYVRRVNDSLGQFGDFFDEEASIVDFDLICHFHLANWDHDEMQRPYFMDHKKHAFAAMGDLSINGPSCVPLKSSHWMRNAKGETVPRPAYVPSKLSFTEYAYDYCDDDNRTRSLDPFTASEDLEDQPMLNTIEEEEEEEDNMFPTDNEPGHPQEKDSLSPPASVNEIGSDSGYASDQANDANKVEDQPRKQSGIDGSENPWTTEEYSPLDPLIPGLRAAEPEAYHPIEINEDFEPLLHVFEESTIDSPPSRSEAHELPSDDESSLLSDNESTGDDHSEEEGQQSTCPTTPTSQIFPTHIETDIPHPSSTPAKEQPSQHSEPIPSAPEELDNPFSEYARAYGSTVIMVGVVLSLW